MRLFSRPARLFFQFVGVLAVIGLMAVALAVPLLPRILQVEDKIQKADYIVPLAGNWHRIIKAAELYKAGYAPKLALSNARVPPPTRFHEIRKAMGIEVPAPREMRHRLMIHLGVPENALLAFGDGHISTSEEAEAFQNFLNQQMTGSKAGKPKGIILVTSPFHSRRAKLIFEAAMPDMRFMMTSPPEGRLKTQWWLDQKSAQLAVSEGFKFMFYLLGGRFRSPVAPF